MKEELLRKLPQVERALQWPRIARLAERYPRPRILRVLRSQLDALRRAILEGTLPEETVDSLTSEDGLGTAIERELERSGRSAYRRVINATGIVLHTGLGRAVLAPKAREAFARELRGYSLVEVDAATGERNQREAPLRPLLSELTGAESATVVNNNAAATLLILAALARGKEVLISRGQLVEIGGSFRIPDILRESGARLVEVGTTNRTYAEDYRRALGPETGLILKVHTSNYELRGFVHHASLEELVALGRRHGVPVVSDLGSGCFTDMEQFGFRREPLVRESVEAGADLVCFSGDKLLGGPQCGVIVGTKEAIARCRSHPLFRALRVDKITLLLLETTLRLYLEGDPTREVPAVRLLARKEEELRVLAEETARAISRRGRGRLRAESVPLTSQAGSGSLPAQEIPSWGIALEHEESPPERLAACLRAGEPPVFARVAGDRVLLDLRTVLEDDLRDLVEAAAALASPESSPEGKPPA